MSTVEPTAAIIDAILRRLRLPLARASEPRIQTAAAEFLTALAHFAELLPAAEHPQDPAELLASVAGTNAFEALRVARGLPVTVIFSAGVHPAYFEGEGRIGAAPWRLCY